MVDIMSRVPMKVNMTYLRNCARKPLKRGIDAGNAGRLEYDGVKGHGGSTVNHNSLSLSEESAASGLLDKRETARMDVFDRIINSSLAFLMLIVATPIIVFCYIFYLCKTAKPRHAFFYSGERLGRDFKPYTMYKIRTLCEDAEFEKQGVILPPDSAREVPGGKFLRNSRLDELPQLWNVVRGDMNLVGPRPMRRVVYEQLRQEISNCDNRFKVKPGLTGYAQFLTPSHTPKRIRFAIDNYWTEKGRHPLRDLFLIGWTIWEVLRKAVSSLFRLAVTRWKILRYRGGGAELRTMERRRFKHTWIQMTDSEFSHPAMPACNLFGCERKGLAPAPDCKQIRLTHLYDINPRAISFYSKEEYPLNSTLYFYLVGCKECETGRRKKARCIGTVYKKYPEDPGAGTEPRYVVFYEPVSPRNRYLVDHYVLHQTVA
jgi:lipopolysaccharide/colanic/teichoic acid biosynthesis glycosyltransferase